MMSIRPWLAVALAAGLAPTTALAAGPFVETPYLQLGDRPRPDSMAVAWIAADADARWSVEARSPVDAAWRPAPPPGSRRVAIEGATPIRVHEATLAGLVPGEPFEYRVSLDGTVAFQARARAKAPPGRPHRFVAFGDCAEGTAAQAQVAYQAYRARPDYVVLTGDIVYPRGRLAEYREWFFPVYAHPTASPRSGAPLLASTLFVAVPGNHDVVRDFDNNVDPMAYFYLWSQPLNGPIGTIGAANTPIGVGNPARLRTFLDAAGTNYPRMANFSFDVGDVHWTMIDANPYVDWDDPALRDWLAHDLAEAIAKPWRFVAFHHPGFNSAKAHSGDQQMRRVAPLLERGGVSLVFNGHVHNYQRSYPLKFAVEADGPDPRSRRINTRVDGTFTLDTEYDDTTRTRPLGVIYLITGAGGAPLYDPDQTTRPASWRPFTRKFVADVHSFTVVDVTPRSVEVRQVDVDGVEVDRFAIGR